MKLTNEQVRWIVRECKLVHGGEVDSKWIFNFGLGLHSDIPICCVVFYCNVWSNLGPDVWDNFKNYRPAPDGVNYIRCPECCKRDNRVKIHKCNPAWQECFYEPFRKMLRPNERRPTLSRRKK